MLLLLATALAADPSPPPPAPGALAPAPNVVPGALAPTYRILGGKGEATLYVNATTGAPEAAVDRLVIEAGGAVPAHVHDASVEILYVVEGRVEMVIGGVKQAAGPGDVVRIPAGVEHSAVATTRLVAVQVYVGPGPEQRFTQGEKLR